jgi:ATP-dependent Clp protease ATP-binding subunit ClpC
MFERFTEKAIKVIMLAQEESRRLGHNFVGTEQILLGLIGEGTGVAAKVLESMGVNIKDAQIEVEKIIGRGSGFVAEEIPFTPRIKRVLELSLEEARQLGHNYIGTEHLLLGLIREGEGVAARVLENLGVDLSKVKTRVMRMIGQLVEVPPMVVVNVNTNTPTLDEFGSNLTQMVLNGTRYYVAGYAKEIEQVIQILGRFNKENPILIGGSKAITRGLAQQIIAAYVPDVLADKWLMTLDIGLLVHKDHKEFEERLKEIVNEIRQKGNVILIIENVHTLIGSGATAKAIEAANILKLALARRELQCIGMTTIDEYRRHIEQNADLEQYFQLVNVGERSVAETIEILHELREQYEQHHKLRITNDALKATAELANQYIVGQFLPDKAINLMDEAASWVRSQMPAAAKELDQELHQVLKDKDDAVRSQDFEKASHLKDRELEIKAEIRNVAQVNRAKTLEVTDILHIVSSWTGVPVSDLA